MKRLFGDMNIIVDGVLEIFLILINYGWLDFLEFKIKRWNSSRIVLVKSEENII